MPLYDFRCEACGEAFEEFAPVGSTAACPACGSEDVKRLYGTFARGSTAGLHGDEARRSNAQRAGREIQRREEHHAQREALAKGERPPPRRTDDTPWWRKVPGGP